MIRRAAVFAAVAGAAVAGGWVARAAPAPAWEVHVAERIELVAGVAGQLAIDVAPGAGRTVSRDGPLRVDLAPADGVTVGRRRLSLADAADPGAAAPRFTVKISAAAPGHYQVAVAVRLWLCARQTCKPVRANRTVAIDVVAPALPDAAPPDAAPPDAGSRRRPRRATP